MGRGELIHTQAFNQSSRRAFLMMTIDKVNMKGEVCVLEKNELRGILHLWKPVAIQSLRSTGSYMYHLVSAEQQLATAAGMEGGMST